METTLTPSSSGWVGGVSLGMPKRSRSDYSHAREKLLKKLQILNIVAVLLTNTAKLNPSKL